MKQMYSCVHAHRLEMEKVCRVKKKVNQINQNPPLLDVQYLFPMVLL